MASSLEELPPLLTPPELAQVLRTTTNSLAQERYLGRGVPFIKNGRRILYARSDVLAYLEQNRAQRTDDPRGAGAG
ncbi:helix-turn-helix domain-containing protein [Mycobacterium avium]|uniref:helix-turn-helix domain-containing protein n=1 Tax=Mycobacterium avium TaxID=1764 RepID=UPI000CE4E07E|nr:helix-turn-helix domain-containing protein [Mycobacterium avium]